MICRLATCDDADREVDDVIKAFGNNKEYIFWGNKLACDCDFLFIHSQGDSIIKGILKVRTVKKKEEINKEDFLLHIPNRWPKEITYNKYFLIERAKKVKGKSVSAKEYFAKRRKMGSAA